MHSILRSAWNAQRTGLKKLLELPYRVGSPETGSAAWLIKKEIQFGGLVTDVARRRTSPVDPRTPDELSAGGMTGGDRMLHHGYAETYARHLRRFIDRPNVILAEFGILRGSGLAIWCDLFPDARIIGFDIDVGHFQEHRPALERKGAFSRNEPEVHSFDQLNPSRNVIESALGGDTIDIVIDDGVHLLEAITNTFDTVKNYLSDDFVYFVEDFSDLAIHASERLEGYSCSSQGTMNVILPKAPE